MNELIMDYNDLRTKVIIKMRDQPLSYTQYAKIIGIARPTLIKFIKGDKIENFTLICKLNNFITKDEDGKI